MCVKVVPDVTYMLLQLNKYMQRRAATGQRSLCALAVAHASSLSLRIVRPVHYM